MCVHALSFWFCLTFTALNTTQHQPPLPPITQLEEGDIIEKLEQLCDASRPEGEWLRMVDIVEAGDALELKDMGKVRACAVL
jgi:hypothetical protein